MRQNIKAYNQDSSSNEFAALLQTDLDKRVTAESSLVNGIVSRIERKIPGSLCQKITFFPKLPPLPKYKAGYPKSIKWNHWKHIS